MTRAEAIRYLTRCADAQGVHWSGGIKWRPDECPTCHGTNDAGWLKTPCSRYGYNSADCAPVAWRFACIIARETGENITTEHLDHAMSLVVNDHDDIESIIREYGSSRDRALLSR